MWFVYIVECADGTLYTGITNNLQQRILVHNEGKNAAKYTRVRRPVLLRYAEKKRSRSTASKREHQVKLLTREQKLALIGGLFLKK